ncbi:MAG: riboflavin biosynthesis protein RibD, partial [Flavobacteriales bacterium]|nr:riboflavin biosynthesis protein RibD [Flavobacteriales bacterium]
PCSHYGKTPPCVDLIIKHKIPNIVIGTLDPFKKVNGKSINKLKKHANVTTGILLNECISLNKKYFINHYFQRPFLILKWAESKDGFINNLKPGITKISCPESIELSHIWRSKIDGIMVGTNTIICDNPQLTNRYSQGKQPIRITIDRHNKLKHNTWNIMDNNANTIIFHNNESKIIDNIKYIDIRLVNEKQNSKILLEIFKKLYKEGVSSLIIEGGKKILETCIEDNLWDEMRIFSCKKMIHEGIKAPKVNYKILKKKKVGNDILKFLYNKKLEKKIEQAF